MTGRLDRIEENLEDITPILASAATYAEAANRRVDQLQADRQMLMSYHQATQSQVNALASQITAIAALSNADRTAEAQAREEFRQQMLGLQQETRRLLETLATLIKPEPPNGESHE